jgi:hypothetical protein
MPDTLAAAALVFAARGFPVGPCCRPTATGCSYAKHAKDAPCKFPGKAPIPYRGVKGYTTDPAKIQQFFRWYPTANYGVAMGRVSGYFVIESDGPQGEAFLRTFHIPPAPTVVSARGVHRYLKIPAGYVVKTTHIGEIDVIGDGDQMIGAGSLHRSGHIYHWQQYLSLEDIDPIEPPEALRLWLVQRGILQLSATQISQRRTSQTAKSASRAFSQSDERPRLTSGAAKSGKASGTATAGEGSKTRASPTTPRLVTPPPEIVPAYPRLVTPVSDFPLAELAKKPELIDHILTFLGLGEVEREAAHLCRLHREQHPSAVLTTGNNGYPVYLDLHADETDLLAYTMPDYYQARLLGRGLKREEKMSGPALMPWWERMLVEMGVLALMPVPHRPLPESAPVSVRQVYAWFLYLCGCKWLYEPNAPTTFSVRFGRKWCSIGSNTTFLQARSLLVAHGYIEALPPMYSKAGQRLELYRPGKEAS